MKKLVFFLLLFLAGFNLVFGQKPKIRFESTLHDFGTIAEKGGPKTHKFYFSNTGDAPLVITKVTASCGCTTPDWTREIIMPGKTGFINVEYNPDGRVGPMDKTVTVTSNADPAEMTLGIKGEVVAVELAPLPTPIIYKQLFPYNSKVLTAADKNFEEFIGKVITHVEKFGRIRIGIESSASNVPTEKYRSNDSLTKIRASDARKKLMDALARKGIGSDKIDFDEDRTLIQGPAYQKDYMENMAEYEKYQYIMITVI